MVFMEILLKKKGFHDKWFALMMECMTTVSYSVLINGEPSDIIHPSWGIKQGDPLSPYLFLICTKGLHDLINQASTSGHIRGISICNSGPRLTRLFFFVDDSLLFCRASVQECYYIQGLLKTYEEALGQQLNRDKTTIFFNKATSTKVLEDIIQILGVLEIKQWKIFEPSFFYR